MIKFEMSSARDNHRRHEVVHIVPRFPPQIDGLGDYCALLVGALARYYAVPSRVVVGDPRWAGSAGEYDVTAIRERTADSLYATIRDARDVILHYVGYGYQHRGMPIWINRALRRWKAESRQRRLLVVFHELWASGPPWRSEFYTGPVQRLLCGNLHLLADASLVSVPVNWRRLEAIRSGSTVFRPIPSAFPTNRPEGSGRAGGDLLNLVAFGQEASRVQSLRTHLKLLKVLHQGGRLGRIRIVGKNARLDGSDTRLLAEFLPVDKIEVFPDVTPEMGAALLRDSDIFLSFYPSAFICKSSALMAALGNGCVPLITEAREAEPLAEGRELLACDGTDGGIQSLLRILSTDGALDRLSQAGRRWYEDNASWPIIAESINGMLQSDGEAPVR